MVCYGALLWFLFDRNGVKSIDLGRLFNRHGNLTTKSLLSEFLLLVGRWATLVSNFLVRLIQYYDLTGYAIYCLAFKVNGLL